MATQDDSTFTFKEQALIEAIAQRSVKLWAERYPNLAQVADTTVSWRDFLYSLAKQTGGIVLAFVALAVLWAVINYIRAGAPAVPGVSH